MSGIDSGVVFRRDDRIDAVSPGFSCGDLSLCTLKVCVDNVFRCFRKSSVFLNPIDLISISSFIVTTLGMAALTLDEGGGVESETVGEDRMFDLVDLIDGVRGICSVARRAVAGCDVVLSVLPNPPDLDDDGKEVDSCKYGVLAFSKINCAIGLFVGIRSGDRE